MASSGSSFLFRSDLDDPWKMPATPSGLIATELVLSRRASVFPSAGWQPIIAKMCLYSGSERSTSATTATTSAGMPPTGTSVMPALRKVLLLLVF